MASCAAGETAHPAIAATAAVSAPPGFSDGPPRVTKLTEPRMVQMTRTRTRFLDERFQMNAG